MKTYLQFLTEDSEVIGIESFVEENKIPSCISYVNVDGENAFEFEKGATMDDQFNIGSVSKAFEKLAILSLIEGGDIKLDDNIFMEKFGLDPVEDGVNKVNYFDWDTWNTVTIEHLLLHKSGIADFNAIDKFHPHYGEYKDVKNPDKWLKLRVLSQYPFLFKPGTGDNYSNSNFYILGWILEEITGKPFKEVIQERILDKAGMTETFNAGDGKPPRLIPGYIGNEKTGELTPGKELGGEGSATAPDFIYYSTGADMLKFGQAIINNKIVSAELMNKFLDLGGYVGQQGATDEGYVCYFDTGNAGTKGSRNGEPITFKEDLILCTMIDVFSTAAREGMVPATNEEWKKIEP